MPQPSKAHQAEIMLLDNLGHSVRRQYICWAQLGRHGPEENGPLVSCPSPYSDHSNTLGAWHSRMRFDLYSHSVGAPDGTCIVPVSLGLCSSLGLAHAQCDSPP